MTWLLHRAGSGRGSVWYALRFVVFGLVIFTSLGLVLYATWQSDALNLKAGQIANRTIKAPRSATFESTARTEERRQEAANDARNVVLRPDPNVGPAQMSALKKALGDIDAIRATSSTDNRLSKADQIRATVEGLSSDDAASIASLSDDSWSRIKTEAQRVLNTVMTEQIQSSDVAALKENLIERVSLALLPSERTLVAALTRPFIRSNVTVDQDLTQKARDAAAKAIEPVMVTVQQGQVIVRDGDPVTKYDIEKLDYFGLLTPSESWQQFVGMLGLLGFVTVALVFYLLRFARGLWDGRQLLMVGLVIVLPVLAGRFLLQSVDYRYMFPAAGAVMLLSILLDFQVAVVSAGFLALYLGIVAGNSFEVTFTAFLASLAGAALIWRAERTMTFIWSGLAVGSATFISGALFELLGGSLEAGRLGSILFAAAVNGAASASLTFLSFSVLGRLFGITTHLQLLELAHPNQPLLYRLAREAPGTYHHSIVVSNLAESAVEVIGGDPLFARVAVLYHDIGKVLRPSFFVENQANLANVHDALDPHTSARIIQEHVLDGVRLGKKARLPKSIVDVIQQHHGTTLIKYFYTQALNNGEAIDEAEFRYSGPRPQTKEAGVIMLADSVEAAVRAASQTGKLYEEPSGQEGAVRRANRLHQIVDGVIQSRLEDGQLDDCDLTFKQIEQIRGTFIAILEGIYHPRIEYPEVKAPLAAAAETQALPAPEPARVS
jgi:putative nucleotidyltransferase with HDIG domain